MRTLVDLADLLIPPVGLVLSAWFYPHCVRPSLAYASAPRHAFTLCLVATALLIAGFLILTVDVVATLFGGRLLSGSWYRPLVISLAAVWLIQAAGYLRPRWFARLGPPDPTAAPRFLLTWFRRHWRGLDEDLARLRYAVSLSSELEKVRVPANADFVDGWVISIRDFVHAAALGRTSAERGRLAFEERLASVVPVDPLAPVL